MRRHELEEIKQKKVEVEFGEEEGESLVEGQRAKRSVEDDDHNQDEERMMDGSRGSGASLSDGARKKARAENRKNAVVLSRLTLPRCRFDIAWTLEGRKLFEVIKELTCSGSNRSAVKTRRVWTGVAGGGLVQDAEEEEGQCGLDPHTAVVNSWMLIEGRPSEVLDLLAAGVLQGSGLCKIPRSQACCSPLLVAAQQSDGIKSSFS
ncbi:uncharacterized protein V6R79_014056 [Siganus canaliculatus]